MSETFAYSEINLLYVSDSEAGTFKTQMKSVFSHEIFRTCMNLCKPLPACIGAVLAILRDFLSFFFMTNTRARVLHKCRLDKQPRNQSQV